MNSTLWVSPRDKIFTANGGFAMAVTREKIFVSWASVISHKEGRQLNVNLILVTVEYAMAMPK